MQVSEQIRVWDGPLRLFHWLLVLAVTGAFISAWLGGNWMLWHGRLGLLVLGLLCFRLLWGFLGSTYARWGRIIRAPLQIPAYLKGQWQGAGHNPLGSLSVLGLLGLLGGQLITGLLGTDDIAFQGPLSTLVKNDTRVWLTGWHHLLQWVLLALIILHVLAIVFYSRVKHQPLVKAMLSGNTPRTHAEQQAAEGGAAWALWLAIVLAAALVWGVSQAPGWLAPPPSSTQPALNW